MKIICTPEELKEIIEKEPRCEQGSGKEKNIEKICIPLVKFMRENCSPHDTLIVTDEYFKMVTDSICIPINEDE